MTVISLIHILYILAQLQNKRDPNLKRLGLIKFKNKPNKRRIAARSGMGNDELEYYDEYDSEYDQEVDLRKKKA